MRLLLDLAPDDELDDSGGNDDELEAELLALMGGGGGGRGGPAAKKPGGKGEDTAFCQQQAMLGTQTFFPHLSLFFASCSSSAHGGH